MLYTERPLGCSISPLNGILTEFRVFCDLQFQTNLRIVENQTCIKSNLISFRFIHIDFIVNKKNYLSTIYNSYKVGYFVAARRKQYDTGPLCKCTVAQLLSPPLNVINPK